MFCLPNLVDLIVIGGVVVVPDIEKKHSWLFKLYHVRSFMWIAFMTSTVVEWKT